MKQITLGIIALFILSTGIASADTIQQIQSPIYKDDIGRAHFLGKGGYSVTRQIQSEEPATTVIDKKEEVQENIKKEVEQKIENKKETNILDVIKESEQPSVNKGSKASFTPESKKMDASAPFGRGMTNIPSAKVNDSKTIYTDDIGRLHFFGKNNIIKE